MIVWLSARAPSNGTSRGEYFVMATVLFIGWWPVVFIPARYGFRAAVGVGLVVSLLLVLVLFSALPTYMALSLVVAAFFAAPPWKAPTTPWAGSDALRVVAILAVGAGTAALCAAGFGFLVVPKAGPAITVCLAVDGWDPAPVYTASNGHGGETTRWFSGYTGGDRTGVIDFLPFTPDSEVDAAVRRAEQDPGVDKVIRSRSATC